MEGVKAVHDAMASIVTSLKEVRDAVVSNSQSINAAMASQAQAAQQAAQQTSQNAAAEQQAARLRDMAARTSIAVATKNKAELQEITRERIRMLEEEAAAQIKLDSERRKQQAIAAIPATAPAGARQAAINTINTDEADRVQRELVALTEKYQRQLVEITIDANDEILQSQMATAMAAIEENKLRGNKERQIAVEQAAAMVIIAKKKNEELRRINADPSLTDAQRQQKVTEAEQAAANERLAVERDYIVKSIKLNEKKQLEIISQNEKFASQRKDNVALAALRGERLIIEAESRQLQAAAKTYTPVVGTTNAQRMADVRALRDLNRAANDEELNAIRQITQARMSDEAAIRNEQVLQSLNQIALRAGVAGAAMVAAFTAALRPAQELEKALAAVAAVSQTNMESTDMMELRDQAIELGSTFIYSSAEIAKGMKNLAQAGFEVPQIKAMTKDILDLAMAADMDLTQAFTVASTTIRSFGLDATEMSRIANVLTNTANKTNVEVMDLAESLKYVGPVAAAAGVELEDVAAALGIMGNAGIKGSMGGTALRQTISSLIAPTANQREMLRELGLQIQDTQGNFVGFAQIVSQLEGIFRDRITDPAKQAGIAMKLFGDRAGPGMLSVINAGFSAFTNLSGELNKSGSAAKTAEDRMKNLTDSMTKLQRSVEGLATTALFPILGVLKSVVDNVASIINSIREWAAENEAVAKALGWVAVFIGLLGTLLIAVAGVTGAFAALALTMQANTRNGITFTAILRAMIPTLKSTGAAAATTGAQLGTFGSGAQIAGAGAARLGIGMRFLLGAFGWVSLLIAAVSVLAIFGPTIMEFLRKLGLVPPKMSDISKETAKANESLTEMSSKMDALLDPQGEALKNSSEDLKEYARQLQDIRDQANKAQKIGGIGAFGAVQDQALATEQQFTKLRLEAESINQVLSPESDEYRKQHELLTKKLTLLQAVGVESAKGLKTQIELAEAAAKASKEDFLTLSKSGETGPVLESAQQGMSAAFARVRSLKEAFLSLKKTASQAMPKTLFEDVFIEDLDKTILRMTEVKKQIDDRNELEKRQLDAQFALEAAVDQRLTKEQIQYKNVNRQIEQNTKATKDLEEANKALIEKAKEQYDVENALYEQANMVQSSRAYALKLEEAGKEVPKESTVTGLGEMAPGERDLKVRREKILAAEKSLNEAIKKQLEDRLSFEKSLLQASTEDIRRIKAAQISLEQSTSDVLFSIKQALATKNEKLDEEERQRAIDLADQRMAAATTQEERDAAALEKRKLLGEQAVAEASKLRSILDNMAPDERTSTLNAWARNGSTAVKKLVSDIRKSDEQLRMDNLDSIGQKANESMGRLAETTQSFLSSGEDISKTYASRLQQATTQQDAAAKAIKSITDELGTLKIKLDETLEKFQEVEDKKIKATVELGFESIDQAQLAAEKLQKTLDEAAKKRTIPILVEVTTNKKGATLLRYENELAQLETAAPVARSEGGAIPGYGGGDSVHTVLEPGEFVIKKTAVRHYGSAFLSLLNNMANPSLGSSIRAITGGAPIRLAQGGMVPATAGGGTYNLNLNLGGKSYPVVGRREVITALTEHLRREGLTTR
jgi:TP901 family phage tail tape measure protein